MKPLITALIDTYNHERYIEQALTSVLEQGFSPAELEIVVVDDGSTDTTPSIVQKFAPRVKHVRKKNGGQASAFNAGFAESHGEIIAPLDGDDWWAKRKLATVVQALEQHPEISAVGHGYYEFDEQTKEERLRIPPAQRIYGIATPEDSRTSIRAWPFLLMGALTVRRKVLDWIMPLPEEMVFMADSAIQIAAIVMGVMVMQEPLFYYRYHAQNLYAAVGPDNAAKLRRKYEMTELVYSTVYRMLLERGIPIETASQLLEWGWIDAKRLTLSTFGGSRLKVFETEMEDFRFSHKNPSAAYRLFKYLIVGASTLLLPPKRFYQFRHWYAQKNLGRLRERLFKQSSSP